MYDHLPVEYVLPIIHRHQAEIRQACDGSRTLHIDNENGRGKMLRKIALIVLASLLLGTVLAGAASAANGTIWPDHGKQAASQNTKPIDPTQM
jgi:hypothetical protein